jgi:hypothetical protein
MYRIVDNNVYNFNKTGFIIGKILAQIVITSLEAASRKKVIQPGNREWVTIV